MAFRTPASLVLSAALAVTLLSVTTPSTGQNSTTGCTWNGDAVYIDVNADGVVSSGDVRITQAGKLAPGTRVAGGGTDMGSPLRPFPGGDGFGFFDVDGDGGLSGGDAAFWDHFSNGVGVGDIFLASMEVNWPGYGNVELPIGHVVGATDSIPGYTTMPWPFAPAFDFVDDDGDNNVDIDDGVYAVQGVGTTVRSKDVRISVPGFGPGTVVGGTSGDRGLALDGTGLAIRYADLDSSGAWGYPGGQAWTDCPNPEPYQQSGGSGAGSSSAPVSSSQQASGGGGGGAQTGGSSAQAGGAASGGNAASSGNGGASSSPSGGGGFKFNTVTIVLAVAVVALLAYVLGSRGKKGEGVLLSAGDVINLGDYRIELVDASDQPIDVPDELGRTRRPDRLVVVIGPAPGVEFSLDGDRLAMGRAEEADVSINHASVSRLHAELVNLGQSRWEVVDQGSSNGIRINGVELRRGIIEPGDALELGDVRLRFVAAGKYFRPAVDLSQQLPALPFEGMTTGQAPTSVGSRNVGTVVAVVAVVLVALIGGGYAMFSGPSSASSASESAPMAENDEQAHQYLDRAKALAGDGDLQGAHDILQKIPDGSPVRDEKDYRALEDGWADMMFQKADQASDPEEKRKLYTLVADATTVSADKRSAAAEKAYALMPEEDRKKHPRPPIMTQPRPNSTWEPPPPSEPKQQATNDDHGQPKPAPVPKKFDENAQKKMLMGKAMAGKASETELRMLKAICMNDGDRACRNMAVQQLNALKNK